MLDRPTRGKRRRQIAMAPADAWGIQSGKALSRRRS